MTEQNYTLAWILPYVRQALKGTSNFEYRNYADALCFQLEKAGVKGIVRCQQPQVYARQFEYDQMPHDLRALVSEAFFHFFHKGYITPETPDGRNPLHRFMVTQRGWAWFQGEEPLPEDASRYMETSP